MNLPPADITWIRHFKRENKQFSVILDWLERVVEWLSVFAFDIFRNNFLINERIKYTFQDKFAWYLSSFSRNLLSCLLLYCPLTFRIKSHMRKHDDRKKESVLPQTLNNELYFKPYPKIYLCRVWPGSEKEPFSTNPELRKFTWARPVFCPVAWKALEEEIGMDGCFGWERKGMWLLSPEGSR